VSAPGIYLDSSALVKLVVVEPESRALRRFLRDHPRRVSCALARAEVPRAVGRHGLDALSRARTLLARTHLLRVDDALLDAAAVLGPARLRALDAIHLAAARSLGDPPVLVTYDVRMAAAARELEIETLSPR
jgi:predicted nucleic acid-binding protein